MHVPLFTLPVIRSYITDFDQDITTFSLQEAMLKLCQKAQTLLEITNCSPKTESVLRNGRVIIVSNHPHGIEPILLFASMPKRKNAYMITNEQFLHISKSLNEHLIPVYIQHVLDKATFQRKRIKFLKAIRPSQNLTVEEAKARNKASIKTAQERIESGSLVLIFPGVELERGWVPGVGRMIQGMTASEPVYIINAYVDGTSKYDFLRLVPLAKKALPTVKVSFSEPKQINHLFRSELNDILKELSGDYCLFRNQLIQ